MQYLGWHYGTCKEKLNKKKILGGRKEEVSNMFCGKSSLMKKKHMLEIRFGVSTTLTTKMLFHFCCNCSHCHCQNQIYIKVMMCMNAAYGQEY